MLGRVILRRKEIPELVKVVLIISLILLNIWLSTFTMFREIWIQFSFVPVVLATLYWRKSGGIFISIVIGILMGPQIPFNSLSDELTLFTMWISKISGYVLITFLSDYLFRRYEKARIIREEELLRSRHTGLFNINKLLLDMKENSLKDEGFLLIVIDIDNFKEISKYFLYDVISEVNKKFIEIISECFPLGVAYSVNTSEYVIMIKEFDITDIEERIIEMIEAFTNSIYIKDHHIRLSVSVGVVDSEEDDSEDEDLINKARIACDRCKEEGFKMFNFDDVYKRNRELYLNISSRIKRAVDNEELYLVYQPIVNLNEGKISSSEILCRWNSHDGRNIGPGEFIKVAEEVGVINHISRWVVKDATEQYLKWMDQGFDIRSAINFCSADLTNENFVQWASDYLDSKNISRKDFGIEITERVIADGNGELRKVLSKLREKKYRIEIDDFGSGFNSLKTIGEIPFDIIKIDKYFIDNLDKENIRTIVKYIINAVHDFEKEVIAEGVEYKWQYDMLKNIGCDMIQGYYFSKPLQADKFIEYYQNFNLENY